MAFVSPTMLEAAADAVRDGIEVFRVLPLFLSAGAHVAQDIPAQTAEVRSRYPKLIVEVLPPIGEDPRFAALLRDWRASRSHPFDALTKLAENM
jgi:sirohydrochlorin ferrochelatase